jgi:hypothetical protein
MVMKKISISVAFLLLIGLVYFICTDYYPGYFSNKANNYIVRNFVDKKYDFDGNVVPPVHRPDGEYFLTPSCLDKDRYKLNEDGVVLVKNMRTNTYVLHPVGIAQYGLCHFTEFTKTNEREAFVIAKRQADYLLSILDDRTGIAYYKFDWLVGKTDQTLVAPWGSAMAQGQILSLFTRIYSITKDDKYFEGGQKAMISLGKSVAEGGLERDLFGYKFYEEYPAKEPDYTLNGFMFTLIGLYDFMSVFNDSVSKKLFKEGMDTLRLALPYYDSQGISLYSLAPRFNSGATENRSPRYHKVHVLQLMVLNRYANDPVFDFFINRWSGYINR